MISQYRQTDDDEIIEEIVDLCQDLNGYLELTAKHAAIGGIGTRIDPFSRIYWRSRWRLPQP